MGPGHRTLFSIGRRYALVPVLEDSRIQAAIVGRGGGARSDLRCRLLFFHARRRSGGGAPRHGDLRGLWNGADRAGIRRSCARAEFGIHSAG